MKKRVLLTFILLFSLFIITGCGKEKQLINYIINDSEELVAIYDDDSRTVIGNFSDILNSEDYAIFPSTDGFYIINDIKTNIIIREYYVSFNTNCDINLSSVKVKWRSKIVEPLITNPGYTLEGWYNGDKKWNFKSNIVEKNLLLEARWIANEYKIFIQEDKVTDCLPIKVKTGEEYNLPELNKDNYEFLGYELEGNIIPSKGIFNYGKDITVKPVWSQTHFLITFNSNGGNKINPVKVKMNSIIETLPTPKREGYDFIGWKLNDEIIKLPYNFTTGNMELNAVWKKQENLKDYDIYYPKFTGDDNFTLDVPSIKDRFTLNNDKTIATIFAPGVSKTKGFYDVNKNFFNDTNLCWAATNANMIAWYLDRCEEAGIDLTGISRNVEDIFNNFRNNWDFTEGYDPLQGFCWYFTGTFTTGIEPSNLLNKNSGKYLINLPNVGEMWSLIDPPKYANYFGNYGLKLPFIDEEITLHSTSEGFCERIINQLHFGPTSIAVVKENGSAASSHAITLWGCDYDVKTGIISKIYVTDSDDEAYQQGTWLKEIKMKKANGERVMKMEDYYLPTGEPSPFVYIMSSTNLLAPTVAKVKNK